MSTLSRIRVFDGVETNVLTRMERFATALEPPDGTEIFIQDDDADAVYAIVGGEGRVRVGAIDRRGKRLMVELFSPGEIFGDIGVIDGCARTASAVTEGRVRLLRIAAAAFLAAMGESPALSLALARMLARRLRRTFALLQDATFETLDVRLARQILYLGTLYGRKTERGVVLGNRMKQGDLADLLGATTRSIITILNSWRSDEIVHYDTDQARLTIVNEAALRALVEHGD